MIPLIVAANTICVSAFAANSGARPIHDIVDGTGFGDTGIIVLLLGSVLAWTAKVLIRAPAFIPFILLQRRPWRTWRFGADAAYGCRS